MAYAVTAAGLLVGSCSAAGPSAHGDADAGDGAKPEAGATCSGNTLYDCDPPCASGTYCLEYWEQGDVDAGADVHNPTSPMSSSCVPSDCMTCDCVLAGCPAYLGDLEACGCGKKGFVLQCGVFSGVSSGQ